MYKSPIEILTDDVKLFMNNAVYTAVQRVGVNVDKEELLRALQYDRGQYEKGYADRKADAEPVWIPVTERLPSVGCDVLFVCESKSYGVGAYSDTYLDFFSGQFPVKGVTHWMPLPQPPKGE